MDLRASAGRRRMAVAATTVTAIATLGFAAAASGATLTLDKACYVFKGKGMPIVSYSGAGYGPGDPVALESNSGFGANTTANAAGDISGTAPAPLPPINAAKAKKFVVDAKDFTPAGTDATVATATSEVTAFAAFHGASKHREPGNRALTEKIKWAFSGFPVGHKLFGHYLHGGKLVTRQEFGRTQAPCGTLVTHKPGYPAKPHHSSYKVQIDTHKKYSKTTQPRLKLKISLSLFF